MNMQNINEIYIEFYNFLEPKWLDDLNVPSFRIFPNSQHWLSVSN